MTSALSDASLEARQGLSLLARRYHAAGWMLGTSGNLSVRVGDGADYRVVITASGRDKGQLGLTDFVEVGPNGVLLASGPKARPSAETSIHLAVYRTRPQARASLHVHTVSSTLCGIAGLANMPNDRPGTLDFTGLEMVKGWGLWHEGAEAHLACFANHTDVPQIADDIERYLASSPQASEVPALLIAGHGLTAWGDSLGAAHRHVEVTEFLSQLQLAR